LLSLLLLTFLFLNIFIFKYFVTCDAGSPPSLQKVEIQAFSIVIDYQPRHLDAAALRSGSFVEVLNLVPWGGVQLDLPRVKGSGLQGWGALGSAIGNAYLQDIASSQVRCH